MSFWSRALDRVLDPTVLLSFDRTGYRRHARSFDSKDLEVDLSGRRALVTGANSGLGLATAHGLARLGAEVVLCCRNAERGERAADEVRAASGNPRVQAATLDVARLDSVRAFAQAQAGLAVDILVHNAGVLPPEFLASVDGIESTWATNVIGPFALTALLWPNQRASADARLIWVSSGGMYPQRLAFDELEDGAAAKPFDGVRAYARTKRAQVVLCELLAEHAAGTRVTVASMHPGWADTPAVQSSLPRFHKLTKAILRSPAEGADTIVWLAAAAKVAGQSGRFWFDRAPRGTHLLPGTHDRGADRARLWSLCETLSGLSFPR